MGIGSRISAALRNAVMSEEIEEAIERIPKPVGSFGFDPWGYNKDGVKVAMSLLKPLYDKYFRVEAIGLENIPKEGRVLIIPNHSGQLPIDGGLVGMALATNPHGPRAPRAMIERWFPTVPFLGNALNETGAVIGDPVNCARMLQNEEAVIVFPEGFRGAGKAFKQRYQLQRFGHGFMHLALTEQAPIVPVGIVGCEETMPSLGNFSAAAKALNLPYVPIAPLVPLPAKVIIHFGKPMHFRGEVENETDVAEKVEHVKDAIYDLMDKGLSMRKGWFK